MMRESCGANDHPDSRLFIQLYRLISTYSLIESPKGSNVASSEIFDALLQIQDIEERNERKKKWETELDKILDSGSNIDALIEATTLLQDHDYCESETSVYANAYVAGYVARKASLRFAKFIVDEKSVVCKNCCDALILSPNDPIPERHKLIELRTKGNLKNPSVKLCNLINILEVAVMKIVGSGKLEEDTLFQVTSALQDSCSVQLIGCTDHAESLTRRIITFYLTTRMYFISKQWNKNNTERAKTRAKRKEAKLVEERDRDDDTYLNEPQIGEIRRERKITFPELKNKRQKIQQDQVQ